MAIDPPAELTAEERETLERDAWQIAVNTPRDRHDAGCRRPCDCSLIGQARDLIIRKYDK